MEEEEMEVALHVLFMERVRMPHVPLFCSAALHRAARGGVVMLRRLGWEGWASTQFTRAGMPPMATVVQFGRKEGVEEKGCPEGATSTKWELPESVRESQEEGEGGEDTTVARAALAAMATALCARSPPSSHGEMVGVEALAVPVPVAVAVPVPVGGSASA